jgi:hypothetical protein
VTVRHYGLLNDGRDKKPGSTQRIDRRAFVNLREALGETQAAAFLCEINEGDDNDDTAATPASPSSCPRTSRAPKLA